MEVDVIPSAALPADGPAAVVRSRPNLVIWVMIGFFETTPMELEEAATIDGAGRWEVFRHVALPIAGSP